MKFVPTVIAILLLGVNSGVLAATDEAALTSPSSASTVRLIVAQKLTYRSSGQYPAVPIQNFELPFGKIAAEFLDAAGARIVGPKATQFDATLTITAEGQALGATYDRAYTRPWCLIGEDLYTGAILLGEITIEVPGMPVYSRPFVARRYPPLCVQLNLGFQSPRNAPFYDVIEWAGSYLPRLTELIGEIYGATPFLSVLENGNGSMRRAAATRLGELGDPVAGEVLVDSLGDRDKLVRRHAAWALGKIGDPRAVLALISKIRDDDFDVRWFAQWALKKITRQDFGNDQHAWRQWWIEQEVDSIWGNPLECLGGWRSYGSLRTSQLGRVPATVGLVGL